MFKIVLLIDFYLKFIFNLKYFKLHILSVSWGDLKFWLPIKKRVFKILFSKFRLK